MLIVGNCIVSEDIADKCFGCDLSKCKGECCVEGDAGAPLEESEIPILEETLPQVLPYMTEAGKKVVEQEGVSSLDHAEEPCTPLVDNRECAYVVWENGMALCAIEKAWRDGKISWQKPISCHLYPIRVDDFGEFRALNYHKWEVCRCAQGCGEPLYKYLKGPLVRKFGEDWYQELVEQCESFLQKKQ